MSATQPESSNNFEMHLQYSVPSERLFAALATTDGVRNWWTRFCEVSETIGGEASFRFPKSGFFATVRVVRREPPHLLEWECLDSKHPESTGFSDLRDWVGTRIRFAIRDLGAGKSQVDFTHFRLTELECHGACSSAWSFFLNESLRGYLEKGKGEPSGEED